MAGNAWFTSLNPLKKLGANSCIANLLVWVLSLDQYLINLYKEDRITVLGSWLNYTFIKIKYNQYQDIFEKKNCFSMKMV